MLLPLLLQVPLQVSLQQVSISHNTVQSGLLWLRLVNTSMQDVAITHNVGTGSSTHSSLERGTAARAGANATGAAGGAAGLLPPGPCDVGALQRSLLIVHGPSAFDMNRWGGCAAAALSSGSCGTCKQAS